MIDLDVSMYNNHMFKFNQNEEHNILFLIQTKSKLIKYDDLTYIIIHQFSNFRDFYSFELKSNTSVFQPVENLDKVVPNSIVEYLFMDTYYDSDKQFSTAFLESIGVIQSKVTENIQILELRIHFTLSDSNPHLDDIELFLKTNKRLRDLELNLQSNETVVRFLKAVEKNYMIKTIRLMSPNPITKEIAEIARSIRDKRVGVEIALNSKSKEFKSLKKK